MIRYVSMFFGLNCNNKWISNFFTGLTLATFSLLVLQITVLIDFNDTLYVLILKIASALTFASKLVSFLIIKFKSVKIFQLFDRLTEHQINSSIKVDNYIFLMKWNAGIFRINCRRTRPRPLGAFFGTHLSIKLFIDNI